ncbi:OLC1v1038036C1 [Oldenlandia corymbosa var. corymbosa]|nr:OLC1v1038036C1 [Oldenlandia corymbosa var. corymbosa]
MEKFREQLEEIKEILVSSSDAENSNKISAFQALYELATANNSSCSTELLGDSANVLVSSLVPGIFHDDAEIGSHALKCLGSILYHPSVVAKITGDNAAMVVNSLVEVITNTRVKSICKLAVWCISVQQFSAAMLDAHFRILLKAVVHALDNPIGSLAITFEAMQALMKLLTLWGEKMREISNLWAPPIYKRLVSVDNRDREMTEKFLPKIKVLLSPAPISLSKALLLDMKNNLISSMLELFNTGMKIQPIKAWGWFIHLLGPNAMKSKHLSNEMLKIAEQAFADIDPQVQIAALAAWESMIDASVPFPVQASMSALVSTPSKEHITLSEGNSCQIEAHKFLRKIKLIMRPLIEIMSKKCDMSVHVTCLNTWSYLLQKVDTSISSDLVMKYILEPLFRVVIQVGPRRDALLWSTCLDLLDAFTSAGISHANGGRRDHKNSKLSEKTAVVGHLVSHKSSWSHRAIKWSAWNLNQLDFFIRMIRSIINQTSNATVHPQFRKLAQDSALKLFRSLLKAVQCFVTATATSYDEIMLCINTVFRFLKEVCENESSRDGNIADSPNASIHLLEMVAGEVDASILGSSLYKMVLDLKCLDKLDPNGAFRYSSSTGIRCISYMDIVPPIVYLNVLFFSVAMKLTSEGADLNAVTDRLYGHMKFCLCSYDTLGSLDLFVGLLLKYEPLDCLAIWRTLAICLKDYTDDKTHSSLLIMGSKNPGYPILLHLLMYPFSLCLHTIGQFNIDLQNVLEVWKLLYASVNHEIHLPGSLLQNFAEDISSALNGYLDHVTNTTGSGAGAQKGDNKQNAHLLVFIGNINVCILEQLILRVSFRRNKIRDDNNEISSSIRNYVKLSSSFLEVALAKEETTASMIQPLRIR